MIIRTGINGSQVRVLPVEYNGERVYVRTNIEKTEDGWTYDEYEFMSNEYEAVKGGSLPTGAIWDAVLRSIERRALEDDAAFYIAKYVALGSSTKVQAWKDYFVQCEDTVNQPTFPSEVEYPERPE